jgi:putative MATE family efflux protein
MLAESNSFLAERPIKNLIWKFALPGIASQLVNAVYNIVDQIFVGWGIGDLGIAAITIVFPLATITTALSVLFGSGAAAKFSLLMGEGKDDEAKSVIGTAISLMLLIGTTIALASMLFLKPLLAFFGATDLIMPHAQPYAFIICLGIPFGIFSTGASFYIRADGSPVYSSAVLLSGAIFNIIFDPIFLFVFDMGIEGIALATILGQILSSLLAAYYLVRKARTFKLRKNDFFPKFQNIKAIFGLGISAFTTHILATIVQIVSINSLKHYGALSKYGSEIAIAASGAVSKAMIVFMSSVLGIALGCQPIYGYNYGSKRYDRVKETYLLAIRYGTTIAVIAFLVLQLFPRPILSLFGSNDPLFYEFGSRYIRIFLFMTFINSLHPTTSTFFTALGKAHIGFWLALMRQGVILLPLMLILPRFMGIDGLLFAGPITDGIAAIVVIILGLWQVRTLTRMQESSVSENTI